MANKTKPTIESVYFKSRVVPPKGQRMVGFRPLQVGDYWLSSLDTNTVIGPAKQNEIGTWRIIVKNEDDEAPNVPPEKFATPVPKPEETSEEATQNLLRALHSLGIDGVLAALADYYYLMAQDSKTPICDSQEKTAAALNALRRRLLERFEKEELPWRDS